MNKTLAFLLGVIVVGVGALLAVYFGMFGATGPQPVTGIVTEPAPEAAAPAARLPEKAPAGTTAQDTAVSGKTADSAVAKSQAVAPAEKPQTVEAGGKEVVVPSFDVLRVEPSGSLVIAGKAAPDSKVDIIAGATPLGSTKAEPNGDFAAVLDNALAPGDHQLVLRSTASDGTAATSTETAVVSIPEKKDGQVLALVEKPGEPSRLITKPQAVEPGAGEVGQGTTEQHAADTAGSQRSAEAAHVAAAPQLPAGPADEVASAKPVQPAAGSAPSAATTAPQAPSTTAKMAGGTPEKLAEARTEPAQAAKPGQEPASAAATSSEEPGSASATPAPPSPASVSAEGKKDQDAALPEGSAEQGGAAASQPKEAAGAPAPTGDEQNDASNVSVEAVEIDGSHVYVAGQATPGMRVLVYANDVLLGASKVSESGRFLVDTQHDLPVGDYIIRADLVGPKGMKVFARAAVPFAREAGDRIAAVAPSIKSAAQGTPPPAQETPGVKADESSTRKQETAAPQTQAAAQASPAPSGAEGTPEPAPAEAADGQSAAQAGGKTEAQENEAAASPQAAASPEARETVAAPLQEVQGSVIIRRGDTLWTIADRTYGRGVRYTTIYLANKAQIRDPDRIWPGQVFTMPQTSIPDDEALKVHRELH